MALRMKGVTGSGRHNIARRLLAAATDGESMSTIKPVTVETLKAFLDAFNRHDLDAIMEFFVDDCRFDAPRGPHPWGRRFAGKDPVREGLWGRFKGIPDVHYGEGRHWVSGSRGVSEWTLTGTSVSGERIEVRGCDLFEFRDGKIAVKDSFWKIVER